MKKHYHKNRFILKTFLILAFLLAASNTFGQLTVNILTTDGATEICQGSTFVLSADVQGGNDDYVIYDWTGDTGPLTIVPPGDVAIFNTNSTPGFYNITLYVEDSDGAFGTANITIELKAAPPASIVAGGPTSFCLGGSVLLTANAGPGYTYQWRRGAADIAGATGQSYTATQAGTYRCRITDPNGCSRLSNSIVVTVYALPNVTATNDGPVCEGGTLQLTGGPNGLVSYTWSAPTTPPYSSNEQSPSIADITLGFAGVYTLTVRDANNCQNSATTTVVVNPLPVAPTSASSDRNNLCADDGGNIVLTATGGSGDILRWYSGSCGGTLVGAGNNLSIPAPTSTTTYYARWESASCGASSCASVTVTVFALPIAYNVTGGGEYCAGGAGLPVGLSGSQVGVSYQLYRNGNPVGSAVNGTGAAISFGNQTLAGTYTVIATHIVSTCTNNMTGSVSIAINALPTVFNVTGGGQYCAGGVGVPVGLSGSQSGINYQLFLNGNPVGSAVAGTGAAISFGNQTGAGTYTVVATNPVTTCTANMNGSASIVINPLPTAFNVTGGGSYCSGGAGLEIGLSGSQNGISYQLLRDGNPAGSAVNGTGAAISFGFHTLAGTYTVLATNTTTSCSSTMTGSVSISINPLPTVFNVTGGGEYCAGGAGVAVGLSGSQNGVSYQLFLNGNPLGAPVNGTGAAISFGNQTGAGTYTVVATNTTTTCVSNMSGTATITINPLPTVFNVTGGGEYCAGGAGVVVGLSGSQNGVSYQLRVNGNPTGTPVNGTGAAISFGLQTAAGTYTVVANNTTTTCTNNMAGSAVIVINPLPTAFNVTGGGEYCAGGAGLPVGLSGSQLGVNYQLFRNAVAVGAPVPGTGAALNFGTFTQAGTYTVTATNTTTTCTASMTGSVTITINPLPTLFNVTGGGQYCAGGAGLPVGLSGSQNGISYQLLLNGNPVGAPVNGTGAAISFGNQTAAGTYTVVATNGTTTCTATMNGSASITINPLPTAFNVTGGGSFCDGTVGAEVGLSGSQIGVSYQLLLNGNPTGTPVAGTSAAISFGFQNQVGTYTVSATNTTTSCSATMTGSVSITSLPLPTAFNVTGGGEYCAGGAGLTVGLSGSQNGVSYQLLLNGNPVGAPVNGTGAAISFGLQTAAGTYTALATNTSTLCENTMTGSAAITINPLPTVFNVTGGGEYCAGGAGVLVGLSGSQVGVSYQLLVNGNPTGAPVNGTGAAISFGLQTAAGTYTVVANNTTTTCTNNMAGSAVIVINPLPTAFNVTGGGEYCAGGAGLTVGLSGSQVGVNYQLLLNGNPTGAPVAGTGAAISFGLQTAAGTYTVSATNTSTTCTAIMSGAVSIVINPLPTVFNVTGGGEYCAGGPGLAVGLSGSQTGVSYQLLLNGNPTGAPVNGTGAAISFGLQTAAGTYTVLATNTTTACFANMNGSVSITINPLPTAFNVTGGGDVCAGSTGVLIGLSGSQLGVNYTLFLDGVSTGITIAGNGGPLSFGNQNQQGTYTVVGTFVTTLCSANMTGSVNITVNPLPTAFNVTGGGEYCAGGAGLAVGLSGSQNGVSYQLHLNGNPVGAPVNGTGAALSFGLQTAAGTYTVIGTNTSTLCDGPMTGSVSITINPLPLVFNLTGGGEYCEGDLGVVVGLSGSETGISYQLLVNGNPTGVPVNGTGGPISFGLQTLAGTYTVVATNNATTCSSNMNGTAIITIIPAIANNTIGSDETICSGNTPSLLTGSIPTGGNGIYNYQWQFSIVGAGGPFADITGENGQNYQPGALTATTWYRRVVVSTPCNSNSNVVQITVNPPISNNTIGNDQAICYNTIPAQLTGSTPSGGSGAYTYQWQRSTTDATGPFADIPSANGINYQPGNLTQNTWFRRVVISPPCLESTSNVIFIEVGAEMIATIDATNVLCFGQTSGTATVNTVGGIIFAPPAEPYTYLWSTGATTQGIANLGTGLVSVTVTDAIGCQATDQVLITQPDYELEAFAGPNATICSGENGGFIALGGNNVNTFTAEGGTPPYTYAWSASPADPTLATQTSLMNPIVSPTVTTTYTVHVIDANGCESTNSTVISLWPTVYADAGGGGDQTIYLCSGGSIALGGTPLGTGPTGFGGTGSFTYQWATVPTSTPMPGIAHPVVAPTVTTKYRVRVRDVAGNNCTAFDTVTVVVVPGITVVAAPDASVCNGNNSGVSFTLSATVNGGSGLGYNYYWTANPADPSLIGQQNAPTPIVSPTVTTTYTVTVTDAEGYACEASDQMVVTVWDEIVLDAGGNQNMCNPANGGSITLGGAPTATGGTAPFNYVWTANPADPSLTDPNSANPVVSPTVNTTYTLVVTDVNLCSETTTVVITVLDEIIADAGSNDQICHPANGGSIQLNGSAIGGSGIFSFAWTPEASLDNPSIANPIATPTSTTVYTLTVTDGFGCSTSDQVTITVADEVIATVSNDEIICHPFNGGTVTLSASGSGGTGAGFSYSWSPVEGLDDPNSPNPVATPQVSTTYTVTVTDLGGTGCADQAQVIINVTPELSVSAGLDQTICNPANGSGTTLNATPVGGSGAGYAYTWTPEEGLSDPNSPNPVANPSVTTLYTVTVRDSNGCEASASVTVSVLPELFAHAGNEETVCYGLGTPIGGSPAATGGSGSGYTYSWEPAGSLDNANIANPFASPTVTTTYTLTVMDGNNCVATDQVTVNVNPQIFANPGNDEVICLGESITLGETPAATGGTAPLTYYWWIAPNIPVSNLENPTVSPTVTTVYNLTVSDANGCFTGSSVTIIVSTGPNALVSADQEICQGETVLLEASGGELYLWSTGETTSTIWVMPDVTTTYTVDVSNSCGTTSLQTIVTVNPGPVANITGDSEACQGEIITLTTDFNADYVYIWNTGETTSSIEVTTGGIYSVTITNPLNTCSSTDQINITFHPLPLALVAEDQIICFGDEVSIGQDPGVVPENTYLWTSDPFDPSLTTPDIANPLVSPTVTTTYTLLETYTLTGCENSNQVVITVVGGLANAGDDVSICEGEEVTLGTSPTPGNTYLWSSSNPDEIFDFESPNPVVSPSVTTTYTLTETYTSVNCTNIDQVVVYVYPQPEAFAGENQSICLGESTTIGGFPGGPVPANTYQWISDPVDASISDPTISNPVVTPTVTTTYTLIETYVATGCTNSNTVVITVNPVPEALVGETASICPGASINIGANNPVPGNTYQWISIPSGFSSTEMNPVANPVVTTTYILTETNNGGCQNSNSVIITVYPQPQLITASDMTFCPGEAGQPIELGGDAIDGYTYNWSSIPEGFTSDESNPVVNPTTSTVYLLNVTSNFGCEAQGSVSITFSNLSMQMPEILKTCLGNGIAIGTGTEVIGGQEPYLFIWTDKESNVISDSQNPFITPTESAYYYLNIIDEAGCVIQDSVYIQTVELPVIDLTSDREGNAIFIGQYITFTALPAGLTKYEFIIDGVTEQSGTSNTYSTNKLKDGQSVVVIATDFECIGEAVEIIVIVNDLPNAFTPDDDGINDVFGVGAELTIFNRWGQVIYDGTQGWDGKYNGRKVSPGTYYYILTVYDANNNKTTMKGSVTVVLDKK